MKIPKYSVVVVHGISDKTGDQQPGFSNALAERVMPDQYVREKYWYEAVWEPVNNALDDKIQDVVLQLVNAYDKTMYWRDAELAKATSKLRKACVWLWWISWWVIERKLVKKITSALGLEEALNAGDGVEVYDETVFFHEVGKRPCATQQLGGVPRVPHPAGLVVGVSNR